MQTPGDSALVQTQQTSPCRPALPTFLPTPVPAQEERGEEKGWVGTRDHGGSFQWLQHIPQHHGDAGCGSAPRTACPHRTAGLYLCRVFSCIVSVLMLCCVSQGCRGLFRDAMLCIFIRSPQLGPRRRRDALAPAGSLVHTEPPRRSPRPLALFAAFLSTTFSPLHPASYVGHGPPGSPAGSGLWDGAGCFSLKSLLKRHLLGEPYLSSCLHATCPTARCVHYRFCSGC